jgi:hypothetical protein
MKRPPQVHITVIQRRGSNHRQAGMYGEYTMTSAAILWPTTTLHNTTVEESNFAAYSHDSGAVSSPMTDATVPWRCNRLQLKNLLLRSGQMTSRIYILSQNVLQNGRLMK